MPNLSPKKAFALAEWSVVEGNTVVIEGVTEKVAWRAFLKTTLDAQLLRGSKVMSRREGFRLD